MENVQLEDTEMVIRKSNDLISAKYKSSLLENQIMAIAMTRIEIDGKNDKSPVCARLYPKEITRLIGRTNNIYRELKTVSKTMLGHSMIIEDGKGNFEAFAVITNADYVDGVFIVTFNEAIRPHILGLQKNYTTLKLSTLTGFEKNTSFRIYELLQKEMYKSRPNINGGLVSVVYGINEFRFMIGLANAEEKGVQKVLAKTSGEIDWDYLYENVAIEKIYSEWRDLRRRIILPAQDELVKRSNIRFEFEGIRCGGNKIRKIKFNIYPNEPDEAIQRDIAERARIIEDTSIDYHQFELPEILYQDFFSEYLNHNGLSSSDLNLFLSKADNDIDKIKSAISLADRQPNISNYVGWIISCIENNYSEPIAVIDGSKDRATYIEEIKEEVANPTIQLRVWHKITQKDDFQDFLNHVGFSQEAIEAVYEDPRERAEMYADWKVGKI